MNVLKKLSSWIMLVLVATTLGGCGSDDAATTAAGTSTVTIQGSGSAN